MAIIIKAMVPMILLWLSYAIFVDHQIYNTHVIQNVFLKSSQKKQALAKQALSNRIGDCKCLGLHFWRQVIASLIPKNGV